MGAGGWGLGVEGSPSTVQGGDAVTRGGTANPRLSTVNLWYYRCLCRSRGPGWVSRSEGKTTVASHASALKAHRQSIKHREQNRQFRSQLRTALKAIRALIEEKDLDKAKGEFAATVSLIDKMATKGIIHDNAAARYKSRLQLSLNKLSAPAA